MADAPDDTPFRYHLELTPQQLKITHTALRSLLDDFGHEQPEIHALIHAVLDKLPDEHAIRAIRLGRESQGADAILAEPEAPAEGPDGEEPPPAVA